MGLRLEQLQSCAPSGAADEPHCKFHCKHSCITWQVLLITASSPSVTTFKTAKCLLHRIQPQNCLELAKLVKKKVSIVFVTEPGKTS